MSDHHEFADRAEKTKSSSNRGFGITFSVVFFLIGSWVLYVGGESYLIWYGIAALFAALSAFAAGLLAPLNRLWMRFGLLLFYIINPIILVLLFFVVLTPYGLLMRLIGKVSLKKGFDKGAATYWVERENGGPSPESIRRQY